MSSKRVFWCGWIVPDNMPADSIMKHWPDPMVGVVTGFGDQYTNWVGPVIAESAEEAEKIIRSVYNDFGWALKMRWDPEDRGTDLNSVIPSRFTYEESVLDRLRQMLSKETEDVK